MTTSESMNELIKYVKENPAEVALVVMVSFVAYQLAGQAVEIASEIASNSIKAREASL